ncbi:unnamed protein product [Mytilus edulis]|uniref:Uncharacterized protein n=1 Tax=Mytilus edulis TaxID=6550 RepID=A0A8S3V9Q5_MYTED|nr:unnamed protein product [Mytilus edulis]
MKSSISFYCGIGSVLNGILYFRNAALRQILGHDTVLVLTLFIQYRKYESANQYIVKLSILDDELALTKRKIDERITVVTENRNLRTLPFTPSEDHLTTGSQWEEWLEGIEREFRYFRITEPEDKKDAMIIYGGKEISRLEKSTPDPVDRRMDVYEKLKRN